MSIEQHVELVTRPTTSTQFYLFNLFADYIVPRGGRIWTNDLLYLLDLLGVSERAARSTLSRMKQRGWFTTHKEGRRSRYAITKRGRMILEEGDKRIFERPFTDWDGKWRLVVYSLPEPKRKLRNRLRTKLIWLGFGGLAPGTWISPHDRQAELEPLLTEAGVDGYVTLFTAKTASDQEIVDRCWDIEGLAEEYCAFIGRYQAEYEAFQEGLTATGHKELSSEACFLRRFWLTYDFQIFPRKDPNLPVDLLPEDWVGFAARDLFMAYRQGLSQGMGDFMDRVVHWGNIA